MRTAYHFFLSNAGYSWNPATETKTQGRVRCARELARAESAYLAAHRDGRAEFLIEPDPEGYMSAGENDAPDQEYYSACLMIDGHHAASLYGIDTDDMTGYMRVVRAALALEAAANL